MKKEELNKIIDFEKNLYYAKYDYNKKAISWACFFNEPYMRILKWQIASRKRDYYRENTGYIFDKLLYLYYTYKVHRLSEQLGIEIPTKNIGVGLLLHHYGSTIINGAARIGKNLHLHGNNCIGNKGGHNSPNPIIGDNVTLGVGAKVIGGVHLANGIIVAAGAVVIDSFEEENIVIGGIPAKKIK